MLPYVLRRALHHVAGHDHVLVFHRSARRDESPPVAPAGYVFQADVPFSRRDSDVGHGGTVRDPVSNDAFPAELISTYDAAQRLHVVRSPSAAIVGWGMSTSPSDGWTISETGTYLSLPERSSVLTSFYVLPEYRGVGLYTYMIAELVLLHASEGAEHAWMWCLASNDASARGIARAGFECVQAHHRRYYGGISRSWSESLLRMR